MRGQGVYNVQKQLVNKPDIISKKCVLAERLQMVKKILALMLSNGIFYCHLVVHFTLLAFNFLILPWLFGDRSLHEWLPVSYACLLASIARRLAAVSFFDDEVRTVV